MLLPESDIQGIRDSLVQLLAGVLGVTTAVARDCLNGLHGQSCSGVTEAKLVNFEQLGGVQLKLFEIGGAGNG